MDDGYTCFDTDISDGIATVTLCRGDELNTMVPAFWDELPRLVREIDASGDARAMVVASTGRHFSAGMDLSVFTGGGGGSGHEVGRVRANLRSNVLHLQETFSCFEKARMPVLAAVQGGCIGGAVDLVTACDMRYATEDAFFCVQEINIGMTADVGTLQRLPKLIPDGVCRELAYTGRRMPAAEAKSVGLVNQVFADHEALLEGVQAVARTIAALDVPVLTGIGHEVDRSVADEVAHTAHKTPTACAAAIVVAARGVLDDLRGLGAAIVVAARRSLDDAAVRGDHLTGRLRQAAGATLTRQGDRLDGLEARLRILDPAAILARGWSITRTSDGELVRSVSDVASGEALRTRLGDGTVASTVD